MVCTTQPSIESLLSTATRVCKRAGYPVDDDQYQSEIALGVVLGLRTFDGQRASISTWCCHLARNQCASYSRQQAEQQKGDEAGAKRGVWMPPVRPPIPMSDFIVLNFVACHGKTRAARLLGMRYYRLLELLNDVALRLQS